MLTSGDVVVVALGSPAGREAGFDHPAVVVTAQRILDASPNVVQVVPLTSKVRGFHAEVEIEPNHGSGLVSRSAAQCQHVRAVSLARLGDTLGNVGAVALAQIRDTLGTILDVAG